MPVSRGRKQSVPSAALRELIGESLRVAESACRGLRGLAGTVVDESKNTFVLETPCGRKRVPKKESVFEVNGALLDGDLLCCRPEERTKKLYRFSVK